MDLKNHRLYLVSFYWTITTITTVGYGDISAGTDFERLFSIVVMIAGVIGFSIATGSLSSIMSNLDSANAKLKEKLNTLEGIKRDYHIG